MGKLVEGFDRNALENKRIDMLKPGDLLFIYGKDDTFPGHVGVYIGNGEVVHALTYGIDIVKTNLLNPLGDSGYHTMGRKIQDSKATYPIPVVYARRIIQNECIKKVLLIRL